MIKENIVLFGASTMGIIAYENLKEEYNIVYYLDNDKDKWGTKLESIIVNSPDMIMFLSSKYEIVITSQYHISIAHQLIKAGVKKFGVYDAYKKLIDFYDYTDIENISRKNNKIALVSNNNSGSNTYALYKYIPKEIKDKYDVRLISENIKDNNYYLDLFESAMVVRTHDSYYMEEQINVQLFHGFVFKGISNMSKYFMQNKKYNQKTWRKLDVITSYSQTYSTLLNACYGVDGNKYVVTGMPRNDLLLKSKGRENLTKILNEDFANKKVALYMPTFRETIYGEVNGSESNYDIFSMADFNIKEFDAFLEGLNLLLIVKLHPSSIKQASNYVELSNLNNIYSLEDSNLLEAELDSYEIINAVDLLITDYSSIYFDYLLLNRPIIFTPLDLEDYEKNRGFLVEPYDFWAPGPKCYTLGELKEEIQKCLSESNYYEKEREIVCNIVHHYKDDNSSQRVWNLIDDLIMTNK